MGESIDVPQNAATQVLGEFEVFLGDVLDPEKERVRLDGQRAKILKQLEVSRKKLGNPKFVEKAPPEVVEEERRRVADQEAQLALIEKNLSALSG